MFFLKGRYNIDKTISDAKLLGLLHRACKEVESKIKPIKILQHSESQKMIETIGMIGVSQSMADIAKLIHKIAPTDDTVLIRGEHGKSQKLFTIYQTEKINHSSQLTALPLRQT